MAITAFTLSDALRSLGPARVFTGNAFRAGGLLPIGATEGPIRFATPYELNQLTAPELTGAVPHQATVTMGEVSITVPIVAGADNLWEKISPTNTQGAGWNTPQNVVSTNLLLVPLSEMSTADPPTLAYDGTTWTPGAPTKAVWLWRAVPRFDEVPYPYENGGKSIIDVTWVGFFDAPRPSGHKIYTIGNPAAQGIPTIRL